MTTPERIAPLVVEGDPRLAARLRPLLDELVDRLDEGFPSSLALGVVDGGGLALRAYGGLACTVGERVPATASTRYDLASLTKVVCTVTLVLLARERGSLDLEDPVKRWLPAFPGETTTLRHLLTHTSGLVPHRPFYATSSGREAIEAAVYEEAAHASPGDLVAYSDLNFMLLGWVLEQCLQEPLDELFAKEVAAPLGMSKAQFRPDRRERRSIAATELDGDQRLEPGLVWGEVHDGNAFALGGVAGHAGLFASLDDLARFVGSLLDPETAGILSPSVVTLLSMRQGVTGDDIRGIGWRLDPVDWGSWPRGTFWHTGFTGTSLLVAPKAGVGIVMLTNAIHPRRRLDDQAALRASVHRRLAEALR